MLLATSFDSLVTNCLDFQDFDLKWIFPLHNVLKEAALYTRAALTVYVSYSYAVRGKTNKKKSNQKGIPPLCLMDGDEHKFFLKDGFWLLKTIQHFMLVGIFK